MNEECIINWVHKTWRFTNSMINKVVTQTPEEYHEELFEKGIDE